jgi:pimeloyl-ACP methyl ester carboxylesterase
VIVLDATPDELVTLVGYLEAVTDKLLIDLVTIAAYDVGGTRILVPQRVEPERWQAQGARAPATPREPGYLAVGAEDFLAVIATAPADQQVFLQRLTDWAVSLGRRGLAQLSTFHGKAGITTLLPRLSDGVGLVNIYKDARSSYLQFWRSVFERRAPEALAAVEAAVGEAGVRQATWFARSPTNCLPR